MKSLITLFLIVVFTISSNSQSTDKSILKGTVYDANGSVVVNAKVTATNAAGQKIETTTTEDGVYTLNLAFNKYEAKWNYKQAKYDIVIQAYGFKKAEIKSYVFIPSQYGKMFLDIALEIAGISSHN